MLLEAPPAEALDGDRAAVTIHFFSTSDSMGTLLLMYGDLISCVDWRSSKKKYVHPMHTFEK
jgi:hypothetical protein